MNRAPSRHRPVPLTIALVALTATAAAAFEKPRKAEKTEKANTNAARMAHAAEHKAMMQQQAALHHQAATQQQHHQAATQQQQHQAGLVGTERGLVRPYGVGGAGVHRGGVGGNHHRNLETGPMVSSLHSVVGHLHKADHDYDGHRVQAIHQLDQAIHTLQPGAGVGANRANGVGTASNQAHLGATNAGAPRLAQAESDAHLRQAHQELQMLEARISGGAGGLAAHHQQAHNHIQQALGHLNSALATR